MSSQQAVELASRNYEVYYYEDSFIETDEKFWVAYALDLDLILVGPYDTQPEAAVGLRTAMAEWIDRLIKEDRHVPAPKGQAGTIIMAVNFGDGDALERDVWSKF